MNRILLLAIAIVAFTSCGGKKEKEEPSVFESLSALKDMANEAEEIEEEGDQLLQATPVDNETLKGLVPDHLDGRKRKSFAVGTGKMVGLHTVEATYTGNENEEIQVSITDGAGETGSAMIYMVRMRLSMDFEENDDYGYEKSTKVRGFKAIEKWQKDSYDENGDGDSELTVLVGNRFLVALKGNTEMSVVKSVFQALDIEAIESLAD